MDQAAHLSILWPTIKFQRILDAWHDGEQGDKIPFVRVGIETQHERIVPIEQVVDADDQVVFYLFPFKRAMQGDIPAYVRWQVVIV